MSTTAHHPNTHRLHHAIRVAMVVALACLLIPAPAPQARAEGSGSITQGYRPYLEWHDTAISGGIPRQTTIKAYARAGEQIFIGSSAMGIGQGDVRFYGPDGTTGNCVAQGSGLIADIGEEQAGTTSDDPANGFVPCVISAAQTSAAGDGIWEFEFISPNPGSNISDNPTTLPIANAWTQSANNHWINAWHISVRNAASARLPGRVFAKYLAYNMGGNNVGLDSTYWIVTNDGYGYTVDMNGIDPFGFVFFSNAEGVTDARGNPSYRSLQLVGNPPNVSLPTGYAIHNPGLPDNIPQGDITHKIFFEEPDPNLPLTARAISGDTWLLPVTIAPPIPQNFAFTGIEGTPGQGGTAPLGGDFTFDVVSDSNYQITLDINANGTFGDGNDRVLLGRAFTGSNTVYWDALDGNGAPAPSGIQAINAAIQTNVGEVHFPFVDAENNARGIQLVRFRGGQASPVKDLVYYNDNYTYTGSDTYDYSPCAAGQTPAPPNGSYPPPLCFGNPSAPRAALLGVNSTSAADPTFGAHAWSSIFGDRRVIDTWAYFPSDPVNLAGAITLAESQLSITKTHAPAQFIPGQPVTYTIRVTNGGPSLAVGATVDDSVPAAIVSATWTCAITTGAGTCNDPSGIGNAIHTTVDLASGAVATYTVTGVLSPSAMGSLVNTASVRRPNDNNDPDLSDNVVSDTAPILAVADLELNKVISTPPPIAANSQVEFTITLRNRGPSPTTGVEVSEPLPASLSFVSASATKGSYSSASGLWTVGGMAVDEVATLTLTTLWNGAPATNTAQVSASALLDPDSTPGNSVGSEDDQASATLPVRIADLALTKRVNAAQVNVGANVIFTIDVTNQGPDGATGVRVSEKLPAGLALVRATPSQGSYNAATSTWVIGSLAANATASLQLEVTVLDVGPFTNGAQISGSNQYDPDSDPNNDVPGEDDQGFATVSGRLADLSLSKSVDNPQPPFNSVIVYTLTLRNAGPSGATGVVVNDRLPAGLSFIAATPSQGSYNAATGDWTVGAVAANASATLAIQARVLTGTTIRNTARISASDQPDPDSTPGNNDGSEDDQASVSLTPQLSDLSLVKSVNPATANVGAEVVFTVAVTNSGPSTATGVEVSEKLPAGLTYVSHTASRGAYNPSTGAWTIGSIGLAEVITLDLRARLTGVGPYTNTAEVSKSDQPDPDSTPGDGSSGQDDQSSVTIGGLMADLSLTKRVNTTALPANGIVTFTIDVRNSGPSPATGVLVGERLPAGAAVLGATPSKGAYNVAAALWTVGNLAVGEVASLSLNVQLSGAGPFVNVAEVTGSDQFDPDSTPNNNTAGEDDQASATVGLGLAPTVADLELTKSAVTLGKLADSASYLITVLNRGPDTATNVEVSEPLPAGLVFVSAAPSQGSYNQSTGTWTIGSIPSGASVSLQILTLITAPPSQVITNVAQISRSDQADPDSTPGNSAAGEDDQASVSFTRLTAVTLTGLRAERQAKGVLVSWTTGVELNSLGFQIYRSSGSRADAVRITPRLILARGGVSGASYSFLDADAAPDVRYNYWLVELGGDGARSEFGPVSPAGLRADLYTVHIPLVIR